MMGKKLRLLVIEDSEDDALLSIEAMRRGGYDPDFIRVDTPQALEAALEDKSWDAIIADYNLPSFTGLDALRIIQAKGIDIPCLLVSGAIGEEQAAEAMKAGFHDFIIKGHLSRLAQAMERELRDATVRREREEALEALRSAHAELEQRVVERTAELQATNNALRTSRKAALNLMEDAVKARKEAEKASADLHRNEARFKLLSETAEQLINFKNIQVVISDLCKKTTEHLNCHVYFCFLVDKKLERLHLSAFAGITDKDAKKIEWLDFGTAVCGWVAAQASPVIVENIFTTPDPRTDLVKSFGIQAYACYPLMVQGNAIGTLSFGARTRTSFSNEDMVLMKRVAAQVATAMERSRLIDELQQSRDKLEFRVQERTVELEKINETLRRSNIALEDFAHVASHDLQEPLRKIMTFSDRLAAMDAESLRDHGHDHLERILNATARMRSLVRDLSKYSRVTSDTNDFKVINLMGPAKDAVADLTLLLEENEGRVDIIELPEVKANENQMRQLFQNLIGNALKYRSDLKPVIRICSIPSAENGFHEIHVEDNGIGFDEIFQDKIFKPFQRLHGNSSPYPGTGMGLAICRRIIEFHGGSIAAKSTPGKGSTFIVKLPEAY